MAENHTLKGFHHFYFGLAVFVGSFIAIFLNTTTWLVLTIGLLGCYIMADDYYQHLRGRDDPKYKSPLHRLYGRIYARWKWVRSLNSFADKIFGG